MLWRSSFSKPGSLLESSLEGCRTILGTQRGDPTLENYPRGFSLGLQRFWGLRLGFRRLSRLGLRFSWPVRLLGAF